MASNEPAADATTSPLDAAFEDARKLAASAAGWVALAIDTVRLRIADRLFSLALVSAAVVCATTLAAAASLLVLGGLRGWLTRISGDPVVGDLATGLLVLAAIGLAGALLRSRWRRSITARSLPARSRDESA